MKKDGKYRFSLQFGSESKEEIQAGELLETLGNKKSRIVVAALNEYMISHPELQNSHCKIEVKFTSSSEYSRSDIEQLVRALVEEKLASPQASSIMRKGDDNAYSNILDDDIAAMLDNIDVFDS